nr:hypothetical protein SHINE37_43705 [Rhizobiaceae bacterium]
MGRLKMPADPSLPGVMPGGKPGESPVNTIVREAGAAPAKHHGTTRRQRTIPGHVLPRRGERSLYRAALREVRGRSRLARRGMAGLLQGPRRPALRHREGREGRLVEARELADCRQWRARFGARRQLGRGREGAGEEGAGEGRGRRRPDRRARQPGRRQPGDAR